MQQRGGQLSRSESSNWELRGTGLARKGQAGDQHRGRVIASEYAGKFCISSVSGSARTTFPRWSAARFRLEAKFC